MSSKLLSLTEVLGIHTKSLFTGCNQSDDVTPALSFHTHTNRDVSQTLASECYWFINTVFEGTSNSLSIWLWWFLSQLLAWGLRQHRKVNTRPRVEDWERIVGYQLCILTPDICLEGPIQPVYQAASGQLAIIFCWDGLRPQVVVVCQAALAPIYSYWQPFSQLSMLNQQQRQPLKESPLIGRSVK